VPTPNGGTHLDHAALYVRRAIRLQQEGFWEEALKAYTAAVATDPTLVTAFLGRALLLRDRQDHKKALADLERVLVLQPDCVGAYMARASCLEGLGSNQQAILDYTAALAFEPDRLDAYLGRARLGTFDKFKRDWESARALGWEPSAEELDRYRHKFLWRDPWWDRFKPTVEPETEEDASIWVERGKHLAARGDFDGANQAWARAQRIGWDPTSGR
jgi:tetratricopeptide (TPR) repeat protein